MKILLVAVNAKYTHMNPALYSIRAFAGDAGKCMEIAEYTINQQPADVLKDIYEKHPQVIGFSCYIWNMRFIGRLLEDIKKILPDSLILLGGPEVAYEAEKVLEDHVPCDGVFTGEGERPWKALAERLIANSEKDIKDIGEIPGILMHGAKVSAGSPEVTEMDDIPFIFEDLSPFDNRMIYYETSRGCPFRCSYCLSSIDKKMRFRSLSKVFPELQHFLDNKVRIVKFTDRTFNADPDHAMGIWRYLAEHDNGVTRFHFEIEAQLLTADEMEFLKSVRGGLFQFEIGVQSVKPETLKAVNRHPDIDRIKEAVKKLKSFGNIPVHVDLIAGLPFENLESFRQSFCEVYSWGADELQLGFLKVLKGTPIEKRAEEFSIVHESRPPYEVISTKWMSFDDILHLKDVEEQLERYGNSGAFRFSMREFEKYFSDPFTMYEYIAGYYAKNLNRFRKQSRMSAYSMLRDMISQRLEELAHAFEGFDLDLPGIKHFDALLLIDLYAREKLKVRPDFIPGGSIQKQLEKDHVREAAIKDNVHIEFFDFDVSSFIKDGSMIPEEENSVRVVFKYDGQGGAVRIEVEKDGALTKVLERNIDYDIAG